MAQSFVLCDFIYLFLQGQGGGGSRDIDLSSVMKLVIDLLAERSLAGSLLGVNGQVHSIYSSGGIHWTPPILMPVYDGLNPCISHINTA